MRKLRWDASEIKTYQEFFSKEDFIQINNYTRRPQWGYGNISNPGEPSAPFFTMPLMKDEFFTGHCMDVIQTKLNQKFKLNDVYCNGHIFGTQGSPHQDSGRDEDFTLLLYSNLVGKDIKKWKPQWGGKTVFFLTKDELTYVLPNPNTATIFPANIFHYAESTTRHFEGLRLSLAWKLSKQ
tara:strand:+ start:35 stop:577 length:543 start_codon:yes stop_codon:yes gene_type:complete